MRKVAALALAVGLSLGAAATAQAQAELPAPRQQDGVVTQSPLPPTASAEGLVIASIHPNDEEGLRKTFEFSGSTIADLRVQEGTVEVLYEEDGLVLRTWDSVERDETRLRKPISPEASFWRMSSIATVDDRGYVERYWDYRDWGGRHSEHVTSYRDFRKAVRGMPPSEIMDKHFVKIGAVAGRDG